MRCIGAAIPEKTACGFVQPVFENNVEKRENGQQLWFCVTDKNRIITNFIPNNSPYKIMSNDIPHINSVEFKKGSCAPIAFYCFAKDKQILFIGKIGQMVAFLSKEVLYSSLPIDAKFKAAQFLHKTYPTRECKMIEYTYLSYYLYLKRLDEEFAKDWEKKILLSDDIDITKLLMIPSMENPINKKIDSAIAYIRSDKLSFTIEKVRRAAHLSFSENPSDAYFATVVNDDGSFKPIIVENLDDIIEARIVDITTNIVKSNPQIFFLMEPASLKEKVY